MRVLSLFAGIGGFDLGLERAGMEIVGQVEIDPYCQKVLAKHWPDVKRMGDIHDVRGDEFGAVDLVCGGPPCQPVSSAGKRQGEDDARWLWPEMVRIILAVRPRYALMENPLGLFDQGRLGIPIGELAEGGYDTEWDCIPAAAVGAHHLRDRVWILAYPRHDGRCAEREQQQAQWAKVADPGGAGSLADAESKRWRTRRQRRSFASGQGQRERALQAVADADGSRLEGRVLGRKRAGECALGASGGTEQDRWLPEPELGRVAHGIPHRVDRLRGLGNAVVPQIVEWIGRRIMEVDRNG